MKDILTKLAALTAKDENGLLPCSCGSTNVDMPIPYSEDSWVICQDCGLSTDEHPSEGDAIDIWNNRPRESALIALVQEAAGEIERLHKDIVGYRAYLNLIAWPEQFEKGATSLEAAQKLAREANRIGKAVDHG